MTVLGIDACIQVCIKPWIRLSRVYARQKGFVMEEKKYQTDCKCDRTKHIKGVVCDVRNCAYHNGECECCAGSISVGPCDADCSAGTACATFKPKAY